MFILVILALMYPEEFPYSYTDMGAQILAPHKRNIPFYTIIFPITGYVSSF